MYKRGIRWSREHDDEIISSLVKEYEYRINLCIRIIIKRIVEIKRLREISYKIEDDFLDIEFVPQIPRSLSEKSTETSENIKPIIILEFISLYPCGIQGQFTANKIAKSEEMKKIL